MPVRVSNCWTGLSLSPHYATAMPPASAGNWKQPQAWARAARKTGKRERVFCASLADVFDIEAPAGAQRRLFELIDETAYALDWQILTKRPQNIGWALDNADAPADFLLKSKC